MPVEHASGGLTFAVRGQQGAGTKNPLYRTGSTSMPAAPRGRVLIATNPPSSRLAARHMPDTRGCYRAHTANATEGYAMSTARPVDVTRASTSVQNLDSATDAALGPLHPRGPASRGCGAIASGDCHPRTVPSAATTSPSIKKFGLGAPADVPAAARLARKCRSPKRHKSTHQRAPSKVNDWAAAPALTGLCRLTSPQRNHPHGHHEGPNALSRSYRNTRLPKLLRWLRNRSQKTRPVPL